MEEKEKKNEPVDISDELTQEQPSEPPKEMKTSVAEPNESLLGSLVLFGLALFLMAAIGYFAFMGYRYYRVSQAEQARPTIESLPMAEKPVVLDQMEPKKEEALKEAAPSLIPAPVEKSTLIVKVLNGGSIKGVAGTFAEKLKTAGFTKTTVGNSFGSYTGQTLYYAKGQAATSAILKEEVIKMYPKVIVKEAPSSDQDASAAAFVIILGR